MEWLESSVVWGYIEPAAFLLTFSVGLMVELVKSFISKKKPIEKDPSLVRRFTGLRLWLIIILAPCGLIFISIWSSQGIDKLLEITGIDFISAEESKSGFGMVSLTVLLTVALGIGVLRLFFKEVPKLPEGKRARRRNILFGKLFASILLLTALFFLCVSRLLKGEGPEFSFLQTIGYFAFFICFSKTFRFNIIGDPEKRKRLAILAFFFLFMLAVYFLLFIDHFALTGNRYATVINSLSIGLVAGATVYVIMRWFDIR